MTKHTRKTVYGFISGVFATVLLAGCVVHVGAHDHSDKKTSHSTVNKRVNVEDGVMANDISSVNGRVSVGDNVTADEISSVNGKVSVGDNVVAREISSVNGKLEIGRNAKVDRDVTVVNGKIEMKAGGQVGNNVETVNGTIELVETEVGNNIETVNGNIYLTDGTVVKGDVIYKGKQNKNNWNNWKNKPPTLSVDIASKIEGNIIIYREVNFEFEDPALMDKVVNRIEDY